MTIVSVKEQFENIMNLPMSLPDKLVRIITQGKDERSWEDVEALQKAAWKISDSRVRNLVDNAVSASYDARYGSEKARQDASGRIISQEKEWKPKTETNSKNIINIGLKFRKLAKSETNENIFRGLERGMNILLGKNQKHIKVCGSFNEGSQKIFIDFLKQKPFPKVLDALKTGLVTDCVLGYQNRNLSEEEKKSKLNNILKIFDKTSEKDGAEEIKLEEDSFDNYVAESSDEENNASETDIKGVLWHSQDSCSECAEYNGKFFELDNIPAVHPNCLCTTEVVTENSLNIDGNKKDLVRNYFAEMAEYEGDIRHPYLDTKGNITVGKGKNVNTWEVFKNIKWVNKEGDIINDEEKREIYDKILREKNKYINFNIPAQKYADIFEISISEEEADRLALEHIENDIDELRKKCDKQSIDFDKLHPSAQKAMLDMQYNMGGKFDVKRWEKFFDALKIEDYEIMAKESERGGVSKKRNDWTYGLFIDAAEAKKTQGKKTK